MYQGHGLSIKSQNTCVKEMHWKYVLYSKGHLSWSGGKCESELMLEKMYASFLIVISCNKDQNILIYMTYTQIFIYRSYEET